MKITKLPDSLDPSTIIKKKIDELNSICPFCGENKKYLFMISDRNEGIELIGNRTWFGPQNRSLKSFFKKWHCWRVDLYRCRTCGAQWETDSYPTDITGLE